MKKLSNSAVNLQQMFMVIEEQILHKYIWKSLM